VTEVPEQSEMTRTLPDVLIAPMEGPVLSEGIFLQAAKPKQAKRIKMLKAGFLIWSTFPMNHPATNPAPKREKKGKRLE
jgi:hypothetical protein